MSESTLEAPPYAPEAVASERPPASEPVPWTLRGFAREHPGWAIAAIAVLVAVPLVLYARTRPSFDAYGWLVWGYQGVHGGLDLGGAPSWKPLPFIFTVPFALAGHYQLWLWMFFDVAVALAGAVFAGRIAYRLTAARTQRDQPEGRDRLTSRGQVAAPGPLDAATTRYAPLAAAIFAGASVLGLQDYFHYILSVQSDPMLVTLTLAAIDMHLVGKYRWTLVFGVLAALGRPEVWPFLGLWGLWAWIKLPWLRWMLYAGVFVIAFMWFGIPTITNHRPDIAGQLAQKSPRELRHNQFFGTLGRFKALEYAPLWVAAAVALVFAVWRRNRVLLALFGGAAGWVIVEIAFAYHGWPALGRYMFEPAAVAAVLGGVALGLLLTELPRLRRGIPGWLGVALAVVLVGASVPGAVARIRAERHDLSHERARTHQIALLGTTTNLLGGAQHIQNCGQPVTDVSYMSALAWLYHRNVGQVGGLQQYVEGAELRNPNLPKVLITPAAAGGWTFRPWHTHPWQVARCRNVDASYVITSHGGTLIRH